MSQQLIDRSPDLKQLRDLGYEIQIKGGYLLIHHIPYVNQAQEIKYGVLVSDLNLRNTTTTAPPSSHVAYFIGEHPCNKDGSKITAIQHASNTQRLQDDLVINHSFSNKPQNGYPDYYCKMSRYAEIISAPAKSIDSSVTEKTFKVIVDENEDAVFRYLDTNSSRANINHISAKFKGQKIAIIGLGGTGAYILDFVAKTPVKEIHLFDGDEFLLHNAFRSPGAASSDDLNQRKPKTQYYEEIYSRMHLNIFSHNTYIGVDNIDVLQGMSYVFIAIDKDSVKKSIIQYLLKLNIPFIDVGLGVNLVDDCLIGSVRVTTGTPDKNDHLFDRISCGDDINNEYASNIQIADLNALNAIMAVVKWKKLSGFYQDLRQEHNSSYSINVSQLANDDCTV
ncbi:ThiF family adenylyltransferase [Parabacteroides sp. FAFU027]|uniref:ThiF family adenylyltransferase n=1 Tax=Parabacteroides sp. FAFU027 TaxID=2922715 RepID=UPI001FAEDCC1|nr:ThiF family adenylyltransferase [Parabacteroides sp. FAFU027]